MRKIPTLFIRDPENMSRVLPEYHSACAWVRAGEGVATRKYDGTCVMLDADGIWWVRREVKPGKSTPANYRPVETDEVTGKTMGWEPAIGSAFFKYLSEAVGPRWAHRPPGTYELVGPKINGNPNRRSAHILIAHASAEELADAPRTFDELAIYLATVPYEGIVWHHPDGRMAKIKRRDFRG
jgi:hypothetical protein